MTRSGSKEENDFGDFIEDDNYGLTTRGAGSMGHADILWLLYPPLRYFVLVEVKSTKKRKLNLSHNDHFKEQYIQIKKLSDMGFDCWYSVRWIGHREDFGTPLKAKFEFYDLILADDYLYQKNQEYPTLKRGHGVTYQQFIKTIFRRANQRHDPIYD